jgi:hypothetical protein
MATGRGRGSNRQTIPQKEFITYELAVIPRRKTLCRSIVPVMDSAISDFDASINSDLP